MKPITLLSKGIEIIDDNESSADSSYKCNFFINVTNSTLTD